MTHHPSTPVARFAGRPGTPAASADRRLHAQAGEIAKRDAVRGALARATIARNQKDNAAAERIVQEALAKSPGEPRLRRALGMFYQSQERWDAAFDIFEAMLAADPNAWDALYQIGRTAALSGQRLDRGAVALQRYLGRPHDLELPPLANARYRLGMVYERQGNKAAARTEYQAALKLDPKLDDAKETQARVTAERCRRQTGRPNAVIEPRSLKALPVLASGRLPHQRTREDHHDGCGSSTATGHS